MPIRGGLPPRNPRFVGREDLLAHVRGLLGNGPVVLLPAAEHQLGGTGRTQLAVEYAYRYADTYDLVWWIPAEQTAGMRAALVGLAQRLGLPEARRHQPHAGRGPGRAEPRRAVPQLAGGLREREPARGHQAVPAQRRRPRAGHQPQSRGGRRRSRRPCRCRCSTGRTAWTSCAGVPRSCPPRTPTGSPSGWTTCRWRWTRPPPSDPRPAGRWTNTCAGSTERVAELAFPTPIRVAWGLAADASARGRRRPPLELLELCAFLASAPVSWQLLWAARGLAAAARAAPHRPDGTPAQGRDAPDRPVRPGRARPAGRTPDRAPAGPRHARPGAQLRTARRPAGRRAGHAGRRRPGRPGRARPPGRGTPRSPRTWCTPTCSAASPRRSASWSINCVRFLYARGDYDSSRDLAAQAVARWTRPPRRDRRADPAGLVPPGQRVARGGPDRRRPGAERADPADPARRARRRRRDHPGHRQQRRRRPAHAGPLRPGPAARRGQPGALPAAVRRELPDRAALRQQPGRRPAAARRLPGRPGAGRAGAAAPPGGAGGGAPRDVSSRGALGLRPVRAGRLRRAPREVARRRRARGWTRTTR